MLKKLEQVGIGYYNNPGNKNISEIQSVMLAIQQCYKNHWDDGFESEPVDVNIIIGISSVYTGVLAKSVEEEIRAKIHKKDSLKFLVGCIDLEGISVQDIIDSIQAVVISKKTPSKILVVCAKSNGNSLAVLLQTTVDTINKASGQSFAFYKELEDIKQFFS